MFFSGVSVSSVTVAASTTAYDLASSTVDAPKGFHWMKAGKGFKLMKNPSTGYKAHKGASKKASFEVQKVHKK